MSWSSRLGSWAAPSRWSPFSARGDPSNTTVHDSDFSYITSEDIENHDRGHHGSRHDSRDIPHHQSRHEPRRTSNLKASRVPRDSDSLIARHQRISYPLHFPAYSIDDGKLTLGDVRDEAARKLDVSDSRRIRMFYKGRNLKDDDRLCLDEGFHSDTPSDILCVVGDPIKDREQRDASGSDDDENDDDDDDSSAAVGTTGTKKKKRRNRKKKSKKSSGTSSPLPPSNVEHLPVPTGAHPAHRTSSPTTPSSTSRPATPQTPQQKLDAIAGNFHDTLMPQCQQYIEAPPTEKAKREFEHKKLTETILAQVLLKLDAVETEGDDVARARRKELVKEVQGYLNQLDSVVKG